MQAVLGRVDAGDALVDPVTVPMAHAGTADSGKEIFTATTPLPDHRPGRVHGSGAAPSPSARRRQRTRPRHAGMTLMGNV